MTVTTLPNGQRLQKAKSVPICAKLRSAARRGSCSTLSTASARLANGVKFGRRRKLSEFQRAEAIKRRAAGETLAAIAKSYAVDISTISRL